MEQVKIFSVNYLEEEESKPIRLSRLSTNEMNQLIVEMANTWLDENKDKIKILHRNSDFTGGSLHLIFAYKVL